MTKDEPREIQSPWDALELNERAGGIRVSVHVRPRSTRAGILGVRERALDVAVTGAPADGAANAELIKLLARALEVRPSDVTIVVGTSGRSKMVQVNGIDCEDARTRLKASR